VSAASPIHTSTNPASSSICCQPARGSPPAIQPVQRSMSRSASGGTGLPLAMSANWSVSGQFAWTPGGAALHVLVNHFKSQSGGGEGVARGAIGPVQVREAAAASHVVDHGVGGDAIEPATEGVVAELAMPQRLQRALEGCGGQVLGHGTLLHPAIDEAVDAWQVEVIELAEGGSIGPGAVHEGPLPVTIHAAGAIRSIHRPWRLWRRIRWGNAPIVTPPYRSTILAYSTVMVFASVRPRTNQPSPLDPSDRIRYVQV